MCIQSLHSRRCQFTSNKWTALINSIFGRQTVFYTLRRIHLLSIYIAGRKMATRYYFETSIFASISIKSTLCQWCVNTNLTVKNKIPSAILLLPKVNNPVMCQFEAPKVTSASEKSLICACIANCSSSGLLFKVLTTSSGEWAMSC